MRPPFKNDKDVLMTSQLNRITWYQNKFHVLMLGHAHNGRLSREKHENSIDNPTQSKRLKNREFRELPHSHLSSVRPKNTMTYRGFPFTIPFSDPHRYGYSKITVAISPPKGGT